jgi:hypothetical protein
MGSRSIKGDNPHNPEIQLFEFFKPGRRMGAAASL